MLGFDTWPSVTDFNHHRTVNPARRYIQLASPGRITQQVIDQNVDHLAQAITIGMHTKPISNTDLRQHASLIQLRLEPRQPLRHQSCQRKLAALQHQPASTSHRQQVQIIHQLSELIELTLDHAQLHGIAGEYLIEHTLHAPHGGVQGCAQFVGNDRAGFTHIALIALQLRGHAVEVADQPLQLVGRVAVHRQASQEITAGDSPGALGNCRELAGQGPRKPQAEANDDRDRGQHQADQYQPVAIGDSRLEIVQRIVLGNHLTQACLIELWLGAQRQQLLTRPRRQMLHKIPVRQCDVDPHAHRDHHHRADRQQAHAQADPAPHGFVVDPRLLKHVRYLNR